MHDISDSSEPAPGGSSRHRRRIALVAVAVSVAVIAAVPLLWGSLSGGGTESDPKPRPEALTGPARTEPVADFNNDGAQDLHSTGENGGGAVSVIYGAHKGSSSGEKAKSGSGKGISGAEGTKSGTKDGKQHRVRLDLDSAGVPGSEGDGVSFGALTVARDFDGDGYTDLAASVSTWKKKSNLPKGTHGGLVVLWGSPTGLSGGSYLKGVPKDYLRTPLGDDPLVAGDMNGDGHSDLVVRIGSERGLGLVKGPFGRDGSTAGKAAVPAPFPDAQDAALVTAFAADLDADGSDDLISSHGTEDDGVGGGKVETGWTAGGPDGFRKAETDLLPGIKSATTGDVDKDGYPDVVLRRFSKGSAPDSAAAGNPLEVFPGSEQGPDPSRRTKLDQDSPGVPGHQDEHGQFAATLDAGDADGDGYADVAVSAPADEGGAEEDDLGKNAVAVLHGGAEGLTGRGAGLVEEPASSQKEGRKYEGTTTGTRFGAALRLGDTDGDGHADLTIGAPRTGGYEGALWSFPARDGKWPQDEAEAHRPGDFGPGPVPADGTLGAKVR